MALPLLQSGGGGGTGGTGTVTSVTLTGDGTVLSSTPSAAVTTTGTLTATLNQQVKNTVLSGPTTGANANPTFRALVGADFPDSGQTAGNGSYLWTMDADDGSIGATATVISPTGANNVLVFKFVNRKTITIRKVVFLNSTVVTAAATASFGIYDNNGNLLLDSGAFSTAVASQTLSNTLGAAVTLYSDTVYWFAQACTNGTNNAVGNGPATLGNSVVPAARNKNVTRQGTAANAYNGTALPATLGVVTGFTNRTPVAILFES